MLYSPSDGGAEHLLGLGAERDGADDDREAARRLLVLEHEREVVYARPQRDDLDRLDHCGARTVVSHLPRAIWSCLWW